MNLEALSTIFGGINEASYFTSYRDLAYISAYPSKVLSLYLPHTLSKYGDPQYLLNLLPFDYIPYSTYTLLDKDFNYIYSGSSSGYYGDGDIDREYLNQVEHGSIYHLQFNTATTSKVFLIWFAIRPPSISHTINLKKLQHSYTNSTTLVNNDELYLNGTSLTLTEPLYVHIVKGKWADGFDPTDIISNPAATLIPFSTNGYLTIREAHNSWFTITSGSFDENGIYTPNVLLKITNEYGVGIERLKRNSRGSYFVSSVNSSNFNSFSSIYGNAKSDPYLGTRLSKLQLFGNLIVKSYFNPDLIGNIVLNVKFTVLATSGVSVNPVVISSSLAVSITPRVLGTSVTLNRPIDITSYSNIVLSNFKPTLANN